MPPRWMPVGATNLPSYLYIWGCPSSGLTDIGVCSYYAIGSRTWTGRDSLALDCDPPPPKRIGPVTVQLVNGAMPWSGMIWIQPNASEHWFGITGEDVTNYFDSTPMLTLPLTTAQKSLLRTVCASAGFPNATDPIFGKYGLKVPPPSSSGYARLLGMNYNCSGSSTLEDCTVGSDLYTSKSRATSSQAGVDCFPAAINLSSWEFRIRPRTGAASVPSIGRVEVRPNNTAPYSGVCSKGQFGAVATLWTALCHRLGFTNTSMGMRSSAITGWNNPLYYLGYSDVPHCPLDASGDSRQLRPGTTLQDCTLGLIGMHQCNENEDLILDCDYPPAASFEMRLAGSSKPGAGRLEMRPSPRYAWGTVADITRANMNDRTSVYAAFTICWTLGFANVTNPVLTTTYGGGSGDILWSSMRCTDKDTDFRLCPSSTFPLGYSYTYPHAYDLGVDCYPQPFATVVKLEAGGAPWKGRIMLQYTPHLPIGSVCNDLFKHNHFAWNAACRSAGFPNVTNARYQHFGPAASNVPISVDDVVCAETDLFLQNCTHRPYGQHNCFHGEDAGVDCYPPPDPIWDWQFRLADGTSATNGRLEMRPSAIMPWGSICAGPYFNHSVASWEAACRSVGIANPPRARWRYFGKGADTVYLDNVSCTAGNKILLNCSMFPINSYRCDASEVAGVDCDAPPEQPSQWQFRLADGRTATSGRLEMRPDTVTPWGAVCRRGLTTFEALRAVCRTAGHPTATRPQLYRTPLSSISPSQPFYLDSAVCNASTPTLNQCSYAPLYSHDCSMAAGDALYVECFPTATAAFSASSSVSLDAGSRSASQWPSRTRVASPSNGTPPRTPSRALTPTGGWPKVARTATLTVLRTPSSKVEVSTTASLRQTLTLTRAAPSDSLALTRSAAEPSTSAAPSAHSNSGTITTSAVTPHPGRRTQTPSKALTFTAANSAAILPPSSPAKTHSRTTTTATPTTPLAEPRTRCDASPLDRTALFDLVQGTPLLRPLVTTYVAAAAAWQEWQEPSRGGGEDEGAATPPPTSIASVVNFTVSLLPSAATGYDMLFPVLSVLSLTARLLEPATLSPVHGASTVSLTVTRHAEAPLTVNGTFSATAAAAGNGAVLLLAVPTTEAVFRHVRCVTAAANLTVIARIVLVDAARDTETGTGGGGGVIELPLVALQSAAASSSDSYGEPCVANSGTTPSSTTSLHTSMAFFRMLSPFSTGPGYAMVLAGSASATGVVFVLQLLTVVWMRARGKATSLLGCAAAARAPALTIAVAEPLWFGVAYAGANLVVVGSSSSSSAHATATPTHVAEVIAGAAVCVATVAMPVIVVLCLRRYVSRRLVLYQCVRPHPIPARLAPHLVPSTRVKPEVLVKVLAPLVSFRSLHPLFPALGSVSPVVTVFVVLVTGLVPGLCRWTHAALAVAHLLLAVMVAATRPRRTTLLNSFTASQFLFIAAVFGWAARMASAAAATDEAKEKAVLTALMTLQTAVVGVRIALVPLAFFSDRLLPYSGVRVVAEFIAGSANSEKGEETLRFFAFRPGDPDYVHDDEDPEMDSATAAAAHRPRQQQAPVATADADKERDEGEELHVVAVEMLRLAEEATTTTTDDDHDESSDQCSDDASSVILVNMPPVTDSHEEEETMAFGTIT